MKNSNKPDDSKELVVIDYYDRIHKQWIKVEVTKEVARFLGSSKKKMRRKQNEYDYYTSPIDNVFNDNRPENEHFLVDEHSDPEIVMEEKEKENLAYAEDEHKKTMIENSLYVLTSGQREAVELTMQNYSQQEIGDKLGVSKNAITSRMKKAKNSIRNFIKDTEN